MEQLGFDFNLGYENAARTARTVKTVPAKKQVPGKLAALAKLAADGATLEAVLEEMYRIAGYRRYENRPVPYIGGYYTDGWYSAEVSGNEVVRAGRKISFDEGFMCLSDGNGMLAYADETGTVWKASYSITWIRMPKMERTYSAGYYGSYRDTFQRGEASQISISKWTPLTRLVPMGSVLLLNKPEALDEILRKTNPYGWEFAGSFEGYNSNGRRIPSFYLLTTPQLEQLVKAGFAFAKTMCENIVLSLSYNHGKSVIPRCSKDENDAFNRLVKPGSGLKEIFQVPKFVWSTMREVDNLRTWDHIRKLLQKQTLDKSTVKEIVSRRFSDKEFGELYHILSVQHGEKQVFTWKSLLAYLDRLDMYQAIGTDEALMLLSDYLTSCRTLGIQPRTDSDSLKREHDVAARQVREKRIEADKAKFAEATQLLKRYDYGEDVFFIRGIRSHDDLFDEASQQRNCVGSYASRIASGYSWIYVMREKRSPDRSLITVELDPETMEIRQKFLACNQPIRNKAQSEFLDRWLRKCKAAKRQGCTVGSLSMA